MILSCEKRIVSELAATPSSGRSWEDSVAFGKPRELWRFLIFPTTILRRFLRKSARFPELRGKAKNGIRIRAGHGSDMGGGFATQFGQYAGNTRYLFGRVARLGWRVG